jgi:type IV secretory pathway VirB10-like protein
MNKLITLLAIFVIFILAMGFYLLNQNDESSHIKNKNDSLEMTKHNNQNLKSTPTISESNISESKIPLETYDTDHTTTTSDSPPTISKTRHNPELSTSQTQEKEKEKEKDKEKESLAQSNNQNGTLKDKSPKGIEKKYLKEFG